MFSFFSLVSIDCCTFCTEVACAQPTFSLPYTRCAVLYGDHPALVCPFLELVIFFSCQFVRLFYDC